MIVNYMQKRRGYWYYVRRVPREVQTFEAYPVVVRSTKIRVGEDPRGIAARVKIREIDAAQNLRWQDLIKGDDPDLRRQYERNVEIAREHGVRYFVKDKVAALPHEEFLHRVRLLRSKPSAEMASAMFGTVMPPALKVSEVLDEYCRLNAASLALKSPNQLKKWRVARERTIQEFIDVAQGDLEVSKITRAHVLAFRDHWNQQAVRGKIQITSANKYLGQLSGLVKSVAEVHQIDISSVFDKLYIGGGKFGKRPSFDNEWVQLVLLADGALKGLNAEARAIVYLVVETGLRVVEACNLTRGTITLDHAIPHIRVRAEGRQLKTEQSERDIPLVGVALMAMQQHPEGFPRYRDKNALASAVINRFLKARFVIDGTQTLYSLRHTFKNRLRSVRCQDEISARLMGHDYELPEYGEPSLEDKLYWLHQIAFIPPSKV